MITVAIIQARMGSTRLPGKAIADIEGHSLTWHVVNRVQQAQSVDEVVVAMPIEGALTQQLIETLRDSGVMLFVSANETNNLVARHQEIVSHFPTNATIVRIPGDNPCVDPDEIDRIIDHYDSQWQPIGPWLYTNLDRNILGNGYPGGLGAEVYSPWFMHWLATNVETAEHREHPHKWAFDTGHVHTITAPAEIRRPQLRFDVNTPEDLDYIRDIYAHVYPVNPNFRTKDILQYLDGKGANDG